MFVNLTSSSILLNSNAYGSNFEIVQMRSASQELEILARHQHPELTIPFLKVILTYLSYYSPLCLLALKLSS